MGNRNRQFGRRARRRIGRELIIVCEGEKTEFGLTNQAGVRAQRLIDRAQAEQADRHQNPCTYVVHLVDSLIKLAEEKPV